MSRPENTKIGCVNSPSAKRAGYVRRVFLVDRTRRIRIVRNDDVEERALIVRLTSIETSFRSRGRNDREPRGVCGIAG